MAQYLHSLLEASSSNFPTNTALKQVDGSSIDYSSLNDRTNQIAQLLKDQGIDPSARVGIYSHKSIAFVTAIFSIMKAGGAYIPLPSDSPIERNSYILQNCGVDFVFVEECFEENLKSGFPGTIGGSQA